VTTFLAQKERDGEQSGVKGCFADEGNILQNRYFVKSDEES
jgi:hypothetical protein